MAEVLVRFEPSVVDESGRSYVVRICGRHAEDGLWEGWIEFDPKDGGYTLLTPRETEQPDRTDLEYWASGVTLPYLEGALARAVQPRTPDLRERTVGPHPTYDRPASPHLEPERTSSPHGLAAQLPDFDTETVESPSGRVPRAALNPYRVYSREGEAALQTQLNALDEVQLRQVIRAYEVVEEGEVDLSAMHRPSLIELIIGGVRRLYGK